MKKYLLVVLFFTLLYVNFVKCRAMHEVLDLSWGFDENTISWPGGRKFEITKRIERTTNGQWYAANEFCAPEHTGTHLDAPYHFNKTGWKVGEIPLKRLIGPGIVLDMRSEVYISGANTTVETKHLQKWVEENGPIPDQCILLVKFGWSKYYKDKDTYLGIDELGELNFPGISAEAAQWIVDTGKIIGVGVDTASTDPGSSTDFPSHAILANHEIYGLENVNIMNELPPMEFVLIIMPMKLMEGTGAAVRITALPSLIAHKYPSADYYMIASQTTP